MKSVNSGDLARGIALFNRGEFFEAHEVLEDVWRAAPAEQKTFLQGLVQVAVAFHHHSTGNRVGMRSVLNRAMKNLANSQNTPDIELVLLMKSLAAWLEALDNCRPLPALPSIRFARAREVL